MRTENTTMYLQGDGSKQNFCCTTHDTSYTPETSLSVSFFVHVVNVGMTDISIFCEVYLGEKLLLELSMPIFGATRSLYMHTNT